MNVKKTIEQLVNEYETQSISGSMFEGLLRDFGMQVQEQQIKVCAQAARLGEYREGENFVMGQSFDEEIFLDTQDLGEGYPAVDIYVRVVPESILNCSRILA